MRTTARRLSTLVAAVTLAGGAALTLGAPANAVELHGYQLGLVEIRLSPDDVLSIENPFVDNSQMCTGIAGSVNDYWATFGLPRAYTAGLCGEQLDFCADRAVAPASVGEPANPYVSVILAPDLTYACSTYTP